MNILLVEDDPYDVKLLQSALRRAGLDVAWQIVEVEDEFMAALAQPVDVIICDFHLPAFSALRVLELTRGIPGSPPVIVVTGAIDDELAADCIKRGAKDYLLKDRLARIGEAIHQVLEQAKKDAEKLAAMESLQISMKQHEILNRLLGHSQKYSAEHAPLVELLSILAKYKPLESALGMKLDVPGFGIYRLDSRGVSQDVVSLPEELVGPEEAGHLEWTGVLEETSQLEGAGQLEEISQLELPLGNKKLSLGSFTVYFPEGLSPGKETLSLLDEFVAVCSNLVLRLRSEKRMRRSLADQEELLREIHHRVMNNLSTIRALINLDLGRQANRDCDPILKLLDIRILSMALVHEMLYDYGSYASINLADFAPVLFSRLADCFSRPAGVVSLQLGGEAVDLPLESAITVGLLLGELFSLSLARGGGSDTVLHLDSVHDGVDKYGPWSLVYRDSRDYGSLSAELDFVRTLVDTDTGGIQQDENGLKITFTIQPRLSI
ncbi:MAG: histidine kinase dimerization/phosphoacceptor domain -containing protein [Spirochaetota bacterium]